MMPGALFAGNGSLMNSMGGLSLEDTGEPFVLLYDPSQIALGAFTSSTENTHNITLITEDISYIKIDEKYLPDSVFEKVGLSTTGKTYDIDGNVVTAKEGAEIFNDYINNKASGKYSHAEGRYTTASGNNSHAEGEGTTASKRNSHAEGESTTASGRNSHSEGYETTASQENSHAEGSKTTALGRSSHIEGESFNKLPDTITASSTNDEIINIWNTTKFSLAKGDISHVEGRDNLALGYCSHAEGFGTIALDGYSHAEGSETTASGQQSHAEGEYTTASGRNSHAEGNNTTASGDGSHTEGCSTIAAGEYSHAEGWFTIASGHRSHVQGKYNVQETDLNAYGYGKYAHIVGNGTSDTKRSNAHTLDWDGNAWFAGDVLVGGTSQDDTTAVKLATEIYVDTKVADLVNSAPETLDTLGELATALQENADVVETLNEAITNKADKSDVAQSDWNVNDETSSSYIQNRPFYSSDLSETIIFEEQELDFSESTYIEINPSTMLVEGKIYTVVYNGETYQCAAKSTEWNAVYIGNESVSDWFDEPVVSSEPFFIATCEPDGWSEMYVEEQGVYTISISTEMVIDYKIDKKYLPDLVGKSTEGTEYVFYDDDGEEYTIFASHGAEVFNDINSNVAIGWYSHAEGSGTTAFGNQSHAEGNETTASGHASHAEGDSTTASGYYSHAEGTETTASG